MKRIDKSPELPSLTQHRLQPHADYDNYVNKQELRNALLAEQGQICCYCMQRISESESKIEHWASQRRYPTRQLIYTNLIAACLGGEGAPRHMQHCDTHKGDADITINPTNRQSDCEDLIRYAADGRIYSDNTAVDRDLNKTLNLNIQTLQNNRKAVLKGAVAGLNRMRPNNPWSRSFLEKEKRKWQNRDIRGAFKPYGQIVVVYLDKKIHRTPV